MATAPRAPLDISWQQCHGASCDLVHNCDDASDPQPVQAPTARPAAVRPASAQPVRQVERQRLTVEDCDAVFGRELRVY